MDLKGLQSNVRAVNGEIQVRKINIFVPFDAMREVDGNRVDRILVNADQLRVSVWDELDEGVGCTRPVSHVELKGDLLILELGMGKPRLESSGEFHGPPTGEDW